MSFVMTNDIKVTDAVTKQYTHFKCSQADWKRLMDNYADWGKVVIPAICRLEKKGSQYDGMDISTGLVFKEGDKIEIRTGYDGNNVLRFKGFIKRINFTVPMEIECEGYAYQLIHKMVNKKYVNQKMRHILEDLVSGTDIRLSKNIPDILVEEAWFQNCTGVQVLDWFKQKMLQTVYFNFDELYVGLRYLSGYSKNYYIQQPARVRHRLNWNVIKDNELLFNENKEGVTVNIHLTVPLKTGGYHKVAAPKPGNEKKLKLYGINAGSEYAKQIRDDKQLQLNYKGYTGKITCFLEPVIDLNMTDEITDFQYNQRTGNYVIEGVEGSFSRSGGRQKAHIGINV